MNLPAELTTLLQDEAYAVLCQESLKEALARISREKQEILSTRPPFGVLATSQTREIFQTSLRSAIDNETGLRTRLDQISQIEVWLKSEIERALRTHLQTASPEFQTCFLAATVVERWERGATSLMDISLALARDAKAVGAALNPVPLPNRPPPSAGAIEQSRLRAVANLRITVLSLHNALAEINEVRDEFRQLCDAEADGLQLPELPEFRPLTWVDGLASLSARQTTSETSRLEAEARSFVSGGLKGLLRQSGEVREACLDAGQAILAQYWRDLRTYAQTNLVHERDVDEVIAELGQHRLAAEVNRRQASFEAANPNALR